MKHEEIFLIFVEYGNLDVSIVEYLPDGIIKQSYSTSCSSNRIGSIHVTLDPEAKYVIYLSASATSCYRIQTIGNWCYRKIPSKTTEKRVDDIFLFNKKISVSKSKPAKIH